LAPPSLSRRYLFNGPQPSVRAHSPTDRETLRTFCRHSRWPVPAKGETATLDTCALTLNAVHCGEVLVCPLAGKVVS
jgi:hypothetical protein